MPRCICCDSTEWNDTMAQDGIDVPITGWVLRDGEDVCNRCEDEIGQAVKELNLEDDEKEES